MADAVYLFPEAQEKIIALENRLQGPNNFIALVDPSFVSKMTLPKDVGAEQVAALRPDLIFLKTYMRQKIGLPLENLGFNVVYLNFESPEEYFREISMLGRILGNENRGREIISFYSDRMNRIKNTVGELKQAEHPSVLLLSHTERGGTVSFNVPPRSWMQSGLIELAGGRPVWDSGFAQNGWQTVGFEQIARWNPDYIIITSYFSNIDDVTRRLEADPLWRSLGAVKNGRLLGFPADFLSWDQPDTRWILGLQWMAKHFHPGRFQNIKMGEEIFAFYRDMYGISESRFESEVVPIMRGDIKLDE